MTLSLLQCVCFMTFVKNQEPVRHVTNVWSCYSTEFISVFGFEPETHDFY